MVHDLRTKSAANILPPGLRDEDWEPNYSSESSDSEVPQELQHLMEAGYTAEEITLGYGVMTKTNESPGTYITPRLTCPLDHA